MKLSEFEAALISDHIDRAKLTLQVLRSISDHLANKEECRGVVYRVAIGVRDEAQIVCRAWPFSFDNSIFFETDVKLNECKGFKVPPIQHIIPNHFSTVYAGCCNGNQAQIYSNRLVPGIYEYRQSTSRKYRKWFKVS